MKLGVCYYPEHWPASVWPQQLQAMTELGLSVVRLGEFAWTKMEPQPGVYNWQWLHEILDLMVSHGLQAVLGTPTATPPAWLIAKHPEILAYDAGGQRRNFGSRRHYCFSSPVYRDYAAQIVTDMLKEFGDHPAVIAWQTDNEYGCHDTIRSYSPEARLAFQDWCRRRYENIEHLNEAWGNIFWSMNYSDFGELDLPQLTVTEANPAHLLDFYQFSSQQVGSFNQLQVELIRSHAPKGDILHNYMGHFTDFDHFAVAKDLDIASWDSYPLGFLLQFETDEVLKERYFRTGHPDDAAFHHDLYRAVGGGRLWVMEQQAGPVNWAPHNGVPLPGMVRLWTLEAFAHGAELVSYFRWQQAPFAQEQFHSGLNLADGSPADVWPELQAVRRELETLADYELGSKPAKVALIFHYPSQWALDILRQGQSFQALRWVQSIYRCLRELGLDLDIIAADQDLSPYELVVLPALAICPSELVEGLEGFAGKILLGPRCGSYTENLGIPSSLAPGELQRLIPVKVHKVESLPRDQGVAVDLGQLESTCIHWREWVQSEIQASYQSRDGVGVLYRHGKVSYLAACLESEGLRHILQEICQSADIPVAKLPEGLRIRRRGELCFAFNYGPHSYDLDPGTPLIIGKNQLEPAQLAVWQGSQTGKVVIR